MTTKLGRRLRADREASGMSMHALGKASGVTGMHISFIENGRTKNPGVVTIAKLARVLKCDAAWLAWGE